MEHTVDRELELPHSPEEVWEALREPDWLGGGAAIEPWPAGEVRAGERSGFVEEADEPRRLTFWWSEPGEEASRVEIELEEIEDGTRLRLRESRPLAVLDARGGELPAVLRAPGPGGAATPELAARR